MKNVTANRSILSFVLAILMLFSVVPTSLYNTIDASAETTGFHVDGTTIRDGNGNAFVMRGVNIPYVWFTNHASSAIKAAARLGSNAVRVVVSDGQAGYYAGKTSADSLRNIINTCKNNKVVCVLEVHDATGSDDTNSLTNAVNYWKEMKSVLQGNEDYVIVNIANEWYGSWNNAYAWAEGYKTAIESLRNAGIKNMLMVDSAGYGQWTNSIFQKGTEVFNADTLSNTVFSIHMYNTAGGNASTVKNNINNALALGVPLVIGEFGADHAGSDVDEATIMSYCTTKNVGYLGWSWMGNEGNLASLDISYDWDGTSLTTWGNTLFNSTYGIKNTSKLCTIFGGNVDESSSTGSTGTEEVIWEGTAEFAKWASPNYDMEVDGIKNAEEGGYIKIDCQATGSGAQVQLATIQNEEDWTPLQDEFGNAQFTVVNDQIFFRLNATQAALLRTADDLHFKGNKVTVTKLTYLSPDYYKGKTVDIWEGDVEITGWTQDVDINTANIPMAEEDGLITFECEIIEGLLEEPDVPQLQISGNDGEWEWFDLHDPATDEAYIVSGNKLVITLTADDARALATASKLYVKGNGVRITKITYSDPNAPINPSSSSTSTPDSSSKVDSSSKNSSSSSSSQASSSQNDSSSTVVNGNTINLWSGSLEIGTTSSTKWSTVVQFPESNVPYAMAGGKLKFTYEASAGSDEENPPQIQFVTSSGSNWHEVKDPSTGDTWFTMDPNGTTYTYEIPSSEVENFAYAGKLMMKGQNCILKQLDYICTSGQTYTSGDSVEIWSGSFNLGNWKDPTDAVGTNIANAQQGGILTVYYTPNDGISNNPQLQIATKVAPDYEWTSMETNDGDSQFTMSLTGSAYHILLNAEQAAALANSDEIWIKGQLATVTKITYTAPGILPGGSTISYNDDSSTTDSSSSSGNDSSSQSGSGNVIAQKGSGTLGWGDDYTLDFNLSGYKTAKIEFTGNAGALKLAVDPGWTELVETSNVSGSYTYTFTSAQIAQFSGAHTLYVQGQDGSISSVKITGSKTGSSSSSNGGNDSSSNGGNDSSSNGGNDSSSTAGDDYTVINQGGSASLTWDTDYTLDFDLTGYKSAKVVVTGNAGALKLAVDPGWTELVETSNLNGTYTYTLSASQVSAFAGPHKLYVQGQDGSVSNVKIIASTVDPNELILPEIVGEPAHVSTNLTLTGIIGANVYYTIPEGYINNYYKIHALFTASGIDDVKVNISKANTKMINGEKAYCFTVPVKSCYMAKRYNVKLVIQRTSNSEVVAETGTSTFAINNYSASLANTGTADEKAFAKALLTYGYYSQKFFLGTTPSSVKPNDLSDVTYRTLRSYASSSTALKDGTVKGTIYGTTLYLDSGTGIRSYIKDLKNVDTDNLYMQYTTPTGNTKRVKAQYSESAGIYFGEIPDVPANRLSTMYSICFTEGTTPITDTVLYSAFSYVYSTLRTPSASADQQNLVKALYKYGLAAEKLIPPVDEDDDGLDTKVTESTMENYAEFAGTIPNVDINGNRLYSQDGLVKNFSTYGNLYDKNLYDNGTGSDTGIIFAGWNEDNYFSDPTLDYKLNFFEEGGDYNVRRMTFIPTYYLETYDEGIKLDDVRTLTPDRQAEIMSEALKMGVRLNYRLHIDPWRFAWGSEPYDEVNPDIPGSQWWRGMFTDVHPMADDYLAMINQGFDALTQTFKKIGNTKLAEPVRFDIGAELMTSVKRYPGEWIQLVEYCKAKRDSIPALKNNVVISFNFCHHVEYLMEIENHPDYLERINGTGLKFSDTPDILYVDNMTEENRALMGEFIKSLDVFSMSQYMPMDIFEPADMTDPNAVTTTPEDVRDALLTHEQNFLQKVLIGKLGIAPDEIPPLFIGEYGMGIKGLTAPNVWERDNWSTSELVTYEAQKKHCEIAIKGLLLYMQDERTVAKSLTLWISGAPYDFLNFYPSMNLGHESEGGAPAQGYPGLEAFNPPAAQALIDYCGGTLKVN